jgi:hypothetical protein
MKLIQRLMFLALGALMLPAVAALAFAQTAPAASVAPAVSVVGATPTTVGGIDINELMTDIGQHNWLAVLLLAAVYVRFLFSAESKFPATWHPNLRPIFFGLASGVVVAMTAHDNGQAWGNAIGTGLLGLLGGGFLDSMVVALFGNTAAAPSWAKWLVGFIGQAASTSSGGSSGGGTATAPVTPSTSTATSANGPVAATRMALGGAALVMALGAVDVGCHETPQAVIAQTIDLTNYACAVADGQPVGQPYVELVCTILQGGEQLVSVIVGSAATPDGGVQSATASVPLTQVRIRMPAAQVPTFLAAHKPLISNPPLAPTVPPAPSAAPTPASAASSAAPAASSAAPAASAPKVTKKAGK